MCNCCAGLDYPLLKVSTIEIRTQTFEVFTRFFTYNARLLYAEKSKIPDDNDNYVAVKTQHACIAEFYWRYMFQTNNDARVYALSTSYETRCREDDGGS